MGRKIAAYFEEADQLGGLEAKMKLAVLTRLTSTRANIEPDSAPNIAKFEAAMAAVRASFGRRAAPGIEPSGPAGEHGAHGPAARLAASPPPTTPPPTVPGGEELLWGVLASLHDAVAVVFGLDGAPMLWWDSKSLAERYAGSLGGRASFGELIGHAVADARASDIHAVIAGADAREAELELQLGGAPAWFSVTISPVHDAHGRVVAGTAFAQDITRRKQSEKQIRESEQRLRLHTRTFVDLVAQKSVFLDDVAQTVRRVTEAAANTLGVARASVWLYDAAKTKIVCADLFERPSGAHSSGIELMAAHFPAYFAALLEELTLAADDAHTDPRTAEFSAPYLTPLGINSMLDVPIWVRGEMIGVICNEHIGPKRAWTTDEANFAYLMANFVALSKQMASAAG